MLEESVELVSSIWGSPCVVDVTVAGEKGAVVVVAGLDVDAAAPAIHAGTFVADDKDDGSDGGIA